jgi:glucosamine--fructose-6-phosphate aminotransferase (isomerizing)
VELTSATYRIFDKSDVQVERPIDKLDEADQVAEKGQYRHFMQKEIFEQPTVLGNTIDGRLASDHIREAIFGYKADGLFAQTKNVHIIACGTSFHSGLVAKYWIEEYANIPVNIAIVKCRSLRELCLSLFHSLVKQPIPSRPCAKPKKTATSAF